MSIEYRAATNDEWAAFGKSVARGFGDHPPADQRSRDRWTRFFQDVSSVGAFEGKEIVGTSGSFMANTTVPGGAKLPAALVTMVTVAATHRRRGVLTNMMRDLLKGAHERGVPIATLWASESVIYGRFGFGMAGQHYEAKIRSDNAQFAHMPDSAGSVRLADRPRIREVGPDIWARTAARQPGMPARRELDWDGPHPLPEDESKPDKKLFYAVYEEDGRADGYLAYKTIDKGMDNGLKDVRVVELIAATDAAQAALYRFLFGIDLVNEVTYPLMAQDDPLWWMLADPRQLRRTPYDAIWLRILDVERTLSARTYSGECDIVFEIEDEFCPWAAGTYRLISDKQGNATCERAESAADIALPAASLATCYFGNAKFADLARAGRAEERTSGALASADRAFAAEREPWCPMQY
ncbi:MAG: GNAT family N-acetyltransferase [Chloroflexi bacterium]|nr:GNAT family N-acetyltransferase [Chloroflexota bacterium]